MVTKRAPVCFEQPACKQVAFGKFITFSAEGPTIPINVP